MPRFGQHTKGVGALRIGQTAKVYSDYEVTAETFIDAPSVSSQFVQWFNPARSMKTFISVYPKMTINVDLCCFSNV